VLSVEIIQGLDSFFSVERCPTAWLVLIMVALANEFKIAEDEIEKARMGNLKKQHDDRGLPGDREPFLFT
jgi:hypothetical protein